MPRTRALGFLIDARGVRSVAGVRRTATAGRTRGGSVPTWPSATPGSAAGGDTGTASKTRSELVIGGGVAGVTWTSVTELGSAASGTVGVTVLGTSAPAGAAADGAALGASAAGAAALDGAVASTGTSTDGAGVASTTSTVGLTAAGAGAGAGVSATGSAGAVVAGETAG